HALTVPLEAFVMFVFLTISLTQ
ncbi:DUF1196 domain-containing protein, partial [Vibrio cholerae]